MVGFVGLLMALALTASGCTPAQPPAAGNAPTPSATQAAKLSTMKLITDGDFEGWNSMDGEVGFKWSDADKASMEKNGTAILEILAQSHPEFTVEGFKPTREILDSTIAAELKPLTVSSAWSTVEAGWLKGVPNEDGPLTGDDQNPFVTNPFLTNRPELLESSGSDYNVVRSWRTSGGEKCSPSDKPIEVNPVAISATTRPEGNSFASAYPLITGKLDLSIPCKEGGKLNVQQMSLTLQLKKENGEWLLSGVSMFPGAGSATNSIEK
jgi:hypothetical protein